MTHATKSLIRLFWKNGFIAKGNFTLASGQQSDYYIDAKKAMLDAKTLTVASHAFWKIMGKKPFDAVGGIEFGSNQIVGGILAVLYDGMQREIIKKRPYIKGFIFRKEAKSHGLVKPFEGTLESGMKVVLVEDVVTTGGSILNVVNKVQELGATVTDVVAVVDRSKGAIKDKLGKINFHALVGIDELLTGEK